MPVYNKDSALLNTLYNVNGSQVNSGYTINGEQIFPTGRNYNDYSISTLFNYPQSKMQGFAIYNDVIAQVREGYSLHLIDIATHTKIREVTMDMGHGNSCEFSDEFYEDGDEFPLFYIRNDGIWVYRIVGTTSTLIRKYSFSANIIGTYVAGFGIDTENRKLYTASYTTGDYVSKTGQMRICVWDMDDVTDNGDGTYSMGFLSSNDFPWFNKYEAVQGCCFHDGLFFISCGYTGTTKQYIVIVDPVTLTIAYSLFISNGPETEGCAWYYNDYLVIGQKISTYSYRKMTFGVI